MTRKVIRIHFLHANVKGGAETIAKEISLYNISDVNIFFFFKELSFFLFFRGKYRLIRTFSLLSFLRNARFKILFFSHFYHTHIIAFIISLISRKKIKVIFMIHSGIYRNTFSFALFTYIIFLGLFIRLIISNKYKVIYTSYYSKKSHQKYLWPDAEVVYFKMPLSNSLALSISKELIFSKNLRVGFVGRYHSDKGKELLIQILKQFHFKKFPNVIFKILIPNLPLKNEIPSHPRIQLIRPTDNIYSFLSKIDILIIPSKNESFPIIMLEAINAGCQIIASQVGGIPELKSENLFLMNYDSPTKWIEEILKYKSVPIEVRKKRIFKLKDKSNLYYYINKIEKFN